MAKHGFGAMGGAGNPFGLDEFESVARQYWNAWGEAMRGAGAPKASPMPGWDEAVAWWSQLAQGGQGGSHDAINRFNAQAQGWFGQIQKLAAQFAGQDAGAAEIARAWKQMLGGAGGNPFADVFRDMRGPGQHDFEAWMEQVRPFLGMLGRDSNRWLDLPTFGFAREHQERWQQLAKAQLAYQEAHQTHNTLMAEAAQAAFERFEQLLADRSEPGRQLGSARALFDLWIDAAEDAYAELALSPRFRDSYANLLNSQMRVRAGVQDEVERACDVLGIPGRHEVDAAHRKIVQLERELRRLRDVVESKSEASVASVPGASKRQTAATAPSKAAKPPARKTTSKLVAKPATARAPADKAPRKRAIAVTAAPRPAAGAASKSTKGKR